MANGNEMAKAVGLLEKQIAANLHFHGINQKG